MSLPQRHPTGNKLKPRRFRGYIWSQQESIRTPLATLSETLRPLPIPPRSALCNTAALQTIASHPHLFKVVTPIHVEIFEKYLQYHPNRPLVESVSYGLRNGFWPFAEEDSSSFPETLEVANGPLSEEDFAHITQYIDEEVLADRYSPAFGPELLPGMYAMPIYTIPKSHSDKVWLINNHSAGPYSLNAMIDRNKIGMRPDNVQDLGQNLLALHAQQPDVSVWLFKSDISKAYRHLPMHPLWQIKQAVKIGDRCHIDRCCCFGSRGSPDIWCSFVALLLWIAIHVKHIDALLAYMDDHFSFDTSSSLTLYKPYNIFLPFKQVSLLRLWDELGVQHEASKQVFGRTLTIIGFLVDPTQMSITLPQDALHDLVQHIREFCSMAPHRQQPLREWQHILGWINWGLNVQPLLRPAIQSSYAKLHNRSHPFALIYLNQRVIHDLNWLADRLLDTAGIYLLRTLSWSANQADLVLYADACPSGLGFWCVNTNQGFIADALPSSFSIEDSIFWFEALTVLSALEWAIAQSMPLFRLLIFSDNLNTVQMFESLRSQSPYDLILLRAIHLLILHHIDLRVWHIPGIFNVVADALSRGLLNVALQYNPHLKISTFIPPRIMLGAQEK